METFKLACFVVVVILLIAAAIDEALHPSPPRDLGDPNDEDPHNRFI